MKFFCKSKNGSNVKVGEMFKHKLGHWLFIKNKAHAMRVFEGYGIQQHVISDKGKEVDLLKTFRTKPNMSIVITDSESGDTYLSLADDWRKHHKLANYGDGAQMFLSKKYMRNIGESSYEQLNTGSQR